MSDDSIADDARAVVAAACSVQGEDFDAVMAGEPGSRARVYAFIALAHRYPHRQQPSLMIACGAPPRIAVHKVVSAIQVSRGDRGYLWFDMRQLNAILARVGWPRMTKKESEVRRKAKAKRVLSAEPAITILIGSLMSEIEALQAELAWAR